MTRMDKFLIGATVASAIALVLLFSVLAHAQAPVVTQPYTGITTQNGSSTIGTGGSTFQSVFAASGAQANPATLKLRAACTLQNNGTHNMQVFFGPLASATTTNSVVLTAGQSVSCNVGGVTLQDQVSITGTAGDAFYAAQQ
jgi:hypothetical protein